MLKDFRKDAACFVATFAYESPNHPQVELAIPLVADAARRNNIVAGMHTASAETAKQAIAAGYRFVSLGYAAKIMFGAALTLLEATFPQARKNKRCTRQKMNRTRNIE